MTKTIKLSCVAILLGIIFYVVLLRPQQQYYYANHVSINGIYLLKPLEVEDFELTDNHSNSFTKNNLKDHWTLLFFGFTHCEMVCPSTLSALNKMYKMVEKSMPNSNLPQVVFISVDPERDTFSKLNEYIGAFNSHFIAAKTTTEKTPSLKKQFHIISTKTKVDKQGSDNYSINHSADILLVNPDAKIQAYFVYPQEPQQMAKDYNSILNHLK